MTGSSARPRVGVIGTGGTISTIGRSRTDLYEYADYGRKVDVDALLSRIADLPEDVDLLPLPFRAISSKAVRPADWLALNDLIDDVSSRSAPDGFVVTHGTATLEETAYFLHLAVKTDVPIVLVGAMRPPSGIGSDANLNVRNAIRVAASPHSRGMGVLVCLNDEIQAAREVTKGSTYRLEAFRSPDLGMLGYADPDHVTYYRRSTRRHAPDTVFDVRGRSELPDVTITYSYAGADGAAIAAAVERGAKGIVSAGLGSGYGTPDEMDALVEAAAAGVLVVQASRVGSGRVPRTTRMQQAGIVAAGNLTPQKARVLAMLALTVTSDPAEIQAMFDEY